VYKDSLPALLPRLGCLPRLPGQRPAQLRAQCCTSSGEKHFQQRLGAERGSALSFVFSFVFSLVRASLLTGQAWVEGEREACNVPPLHGQRQGRGLKVYAAIVFIGFMRV